jgi:hypothetical protein
MKSLKMKTVLTASIAVLFALMMAGCSTGDDDTPYTRSHVEENSHPLAGKLLILQAYGTGDTTDGSVSHSFVELYNNTDAAINLNGYSLQYAAGTKEADGATEDGDWTVIELSGSIPAKASYLILGQKKNLSGRHQITDDSGNINEEDFVLSNRAFKVALIHSTAKLTVQNPFNIGAGKTVAGYIDMVGAKNDDTDQILGYEETPARISKQVSVRRIYLTDTNDNGTDFESADYRSTGMTAEELEAKRPRNTTYGAWNPTQDPDEPEPPEARKSLMILQIGASTDGAISHSFVELYNNTAAPINLSTYSLQYANGTKVETGATEDEAWEKIDLSGAVQPYHSFLILGNKGTGAEPRLLIEDAYGNINGDFALSNRAVRIALMSNRNLLNVQNPFDTNGTGTKAAGYVDMVGAVNDQTDQILGYEFAPARLSKQQAPRRQFLSDTDNNSVDFTPVDYRSTGISDAELPRVRPKNHAYGAWDPVTGEQGEPQEPVEPDPDEDEYEGLPPTVAGASSEHAGKLLILQIGAATDGNISHSFVELYNNSAADISLSSFTLQYAEGTKAAAGANKDGKWQKIDLTGKTIQAGRSFLILGKKGTMVGPALSITDDYGDINDGNFELSNRAVKVALVESTNLLTVQNPFNMNGGKAAGYVDMLGVTNDNTDKILGYEGSTAPAGTAPFRISKQAGVRRTSLTDTDVNSADFAMVTYADLNATPGVKEIMRPKNNAHGAWDPFEESGEPGEPGEPGDETEEPGLPDTLEGKLLILQAYGTGDATDGSVSHSFVELYNTTSTAVSLTGYSLQYADGTKVATGANKDMDWTVIELNGSIPARGSYLILGKKANTAGRYQITDNSGDINNTNFVLSNRAFKVALLHRTTELTVQNPFNVDGIGGKANAYIDMVGATNDDTDQILGYEAAVARISKQVSVRRKNITDTNNNSNDFESVDYRSTGISNAVLDVKKPRNASAGTWDPFAAPVEPPSTAGLMIFQVFGAHANNDSAPTHSFIELYNNSSAAINLNSFSVHWANGNSTNANAPAEKDVWHKINLSGSIPAKGSYLILGRQVVTTFSGTNGRLNLTTTAADLTDANFAMSNRSWKVALMSNQNNITGANPWGDAACIDLVSAVNTGGGTDSVTAAKGSSDLTAINAATAGGSTISKQKSFRRKSLTISGVTLTDFTSIQYSTVTDADITKFRPRNGAAGSWTPQF